MSLIYLLSSLPMLTFGAAPPVTAEAFIDACRGQLHATDAAVAEALLRGTPSAHPFVEAWLDKDTILRNAVARERARRAGLPPERWLRPARGCDSLVESLVEDAFDEADPLKRERALDKARWVIADELQGHDPLCLTAVFAYAVKLALLLRWSALNPDSGRQAFDHLTQVPITL